MTLWAKRIRKYRSELQGASSAPDIIGACLLLLRKRGRGSFEFGSISLASRASESFRIPQNSGLSKAYRELNEDPFVLAFIERLLDGWYTINLIVQWRVEGNRISPTIVHAGNQYRRGPSGEIRAALGEALGEMGADYLLHQASTKSAERRNIGLLTSGGNMLPGSAVLGAEWHRQIRRNTPRRF